MPYYKNKSLDDLLNSGKTFTLEELKTLIIPSINEGLNALHSEGLIYKNLKPSNLILDDARKNIVLTDFWGCSDNLGREGLGSDTNTETKDKTFNLSQNENHSFYYLAPEAIQGIFNKETDYYALGITLFELFTGVTPYQTLQNLQYSKNLGLTQDEKVTLTSIHKLELEFPDNFPKSLKNLVLGLTYKDLSTSNDLSNSKHQGNLSHRWGYFEVNNWLKGIEQVVPKEKTQVFTNIDKTTNIDNLTNINKPTNISNPSNNPIDTNDPINKPLNINNSISKSNNTPRETPEKENTAIYRFNDIKYLNLQELILAMFKDIPNGIKDLERGKLSTFFDNNEIFRENLGKLCYEAQNNLSNGKLPKAQIFTALLYDLKPNMQSLFIGKLEFKSLIDLAHYIQKVSTLNDETFIKKLMWAIKNGVITSYSQKVLKSATIQKVILSFIDFMNNGECSPRDYAQIFAWSIFGPKSKECKLFSQNFEFQNFEEMGAKLIDAAVNFPQDTKFIKEIRVSFNCELLMAYANIVLGNNDLAKNLLDFFINDITKRKNLSDITYALKFGYLISSSRKIRINKNLYNSPKDYVATFASFRKNSPLKFAQYINDVARTLNFYINVLPKDDSLILRELINSSQNIINKHGRYLTLKNNLKVFFKNTLIMGGILLVLALTIFIIGKFYYEELLTFIADYYIHIFVIGGIFLISYKVIKNLEEFKKFKEWFKAFIFDILNLLKNGFCILLIGLILYLIVAHIFKSHDDKNVEETTDSNIVSSFQIRPTNGNKNQNPSQNLKGNTSKEKGSNTHGSTNQEVSINDSSSQESITYDGIQYGSTIDESITKPTNYPRNQTLKNEKSPQNSSAKECLEYGKAYYWGREVFVNYPKAYEYFKMGCKKGDIHACDNAASMAYKGKGIKQNLNDVLTFAIKACPSLEAKPQSTGCALLGLSYIKGFAGTKVDTTKGLNMLNISCDLKNFEACKFLGDLNHEGKILTKNETKAKELYEKSCTHNHIESCNKLGELYFQGHTWPKNLPKSLAYYDKSCSLGDGKICDFLGNVYMEGRDGIIKDRMKGRKYYRQGCKLGIKEACDKI